jgi:hypothetical protein
MDDLAARLGQAQRYKDFGARLGQGSKAQDGGRPRGHVRAKHKVGKIFGACLVQGYHQGDVAS